MKNGYIHSIETFGSVDGPGLRFVVFMQGCPLRCLYCHNPNSWDLSKGSKMSVDEILALFEKNRPYYKNGGITVTGGEPLVQLDFLTSLFKEAHLRGIHTCLDTSGITFRHENEKSFIELLSYTDLVLLDIKHMNPDTHTYLTGSSNEAVFNFAHFLDTHHIPIWIRYVLVRNLTDDTLDLQALGRFIATISSVTSIDILPYHTYGIEKYKSLGLPYALEGILPTTKEECLTARQIVLDSIRSARKDPPKNT